MTAQMKVLLFRHFKQRVCFLPGEHQRFFEYHMLAGFHHLNAQFDMGVRRNCDNDGIDVFVAAEAL